MVTENQEPLVLIADNDVGISSLLQEVLSRSGVRTAAVEDGQAAVDFIFAREVSLLVCDLDMPKLGGEEVLERLGGLDSPPPVLVISGYVDGEIERQLLGHVSVRGVFRKPFDIFAFADTVVGLVKSGGDVVGSAS